MSTRVDPDLCREVAKFGAEDTQQCIHCGNCTAVCSLSEGNLAFPRKTIRYLQLGLKEKLVQSPEPWLCYYCGECSDTCPRGANPGETMMALRRWLTAQYDGSGLAARFYSSSKHLWAAILTRQPFRWSCLRCSIWLPGCGGSRPTASNSTVLHRSCGSGRPCCFTSPSWDIESPRERSPWAGPSWETPGRTFRSRFT